ASTPILIGNIVNYFFDELIHQPDLNYSEVIKDTFRLAPEQFSCMDDKQLTECISKIRTHFNNLRNVVKNELTETGITKEKAYLEPSFYSNEYGLYGRLDLYHYNESDRQSDIVELKSGKLFRSNSYGLNENHYIQTLLYDLIIESVYKGKVKSNNYILYSYLDSQRLKYAPKVRSKQYTASILRNDIVILEHLLAKLDNDKYAFLLDKMNPEDIPSEFTFVKRDSRQYFNAFQGLDALEKIYIRTFLAFISREYILSKTGEHGVHKLNGMASLWLDPIEEKIEKFSILNGLEINRNESAEDIPCLSLSYSEHSALLSKFRKGDICVLYPAKGRRSDVLKHQIFKCTILNIDDTGIEIRLRARQKNHDVFKSNQYWNLESDFLDSSFNQLYYALYDFMIARPEYRKLVFGLKAPQSGEMSIKPETASLSSEQKLLLKKGIEAKDYFLLWGPPGTGKTSVMIRSYVDHYYRNTNDNILLLAYTNRAVDEICETISKVVGDKFIRIGSRYSTGEKYVNSLLRVRTEEIQNRKDLLHLIKNTRIFVSTISSIQGKRELFKLKRFDLTIIDEASQLLEPMLIGLLGRFSKFIMIGDHKQLPAVVTQKESRSKVESEQLQTKIGLTDCRISLFERMYKNCINKGWENAYGALSYQGRMHIDIQNFVSPVFYDGLLKPLTILERLSAVSVFKSRDKIRRMLIKERMIFVNVPVDNSLTSKTNKLEASIVARMVNEWKGIYKENEQNITESSIGVITPFRAQIAMIRSLLTNSEEITIDTVERYQGGARNQIIISLAVSRADMIDSISNYSEEGVDRKLNVALTRAREHLIILGSVNILKSNPVYSELINYCELIDYSEII
ncbi:MAG: AAA family ATPase, partial [Bacteroidia bacterium]|nr:AAA family ATPase [Bacteroidia bacterium]